MEIQDLIYDLVEAYQTRFPAMMGELHLKRVTASPPEAVTEWPWMYFVLSEGEASFLAYAALRDLAPTRAAMPPEVRRNPLDLAHHFKAQVLVRPRRDVVEDDRIARLFITPLLQVAAEIRTGAQLIDVRPTGYRYGVLPFGALDKPVEFMGIELYFDARLEA